MKIKRKTPKEKRAGLHCGVRLDPNADQRVIRHLNCVFNAIIDLQKRIREDFRNLADQSLAEYVQHQLNFTADAVHPVLILSNHGDWRGIAMLKRPIMEFCVRTQYGLEHPEYAQWFAEVDKYEKFIQTSSRRMAPETRRAWLDDLYERRRKYRDLLPQVRSLRGLQPFDEITFGEMCQTILGNDGTRASYRINSMLMHGDAGAVIHFDDYDHVSGHRDLLDISEWLLRTGVLVCEWLGNPKAAFERFVHETDVFDALRAAYDDTQQIA